MADISQIKPIDGTVYNLKDKSAVASVTYNESTGLVTITKRDGTSTTFTIEAGGGGDAAHWIGTKAQYDALATKNPNTIYITTDEDTETFVDSNTMAAHIAANNPHNITASTINAYTKIEVDNKFTSTNQNVSNLSTKVNALPAIRYGITTPASTLGSDGDIYVKYSS